MLIYINSSMSYSLWLRWVTFLTGFTEVSDNVIYSHLYVYKKIVFVLYVYKRTPNSGAKHAITTTGWEQGKF